MAYAHVTHATAIREHLASNPTKAFTQDELYEAIDVHEKQKSIFLSVLADMASGGKVLVLTQQGATKYAAGRMPKEAQNFHVSKIDAHDEIQKPRPEYQLPPRPKDGSPEASQIDDEIIKYVKLFPGHRGKEIARAVHDILGWVLPSDVSDRLPKLVNQHHIGRQGHGGGTRYWPLNVLQKNVAVEIKRQIPEIHEPDGRSVSKMPDHVQRVIEDLLARRDKLNCTIQTLKDMYAEG
jgi:hypothetical protein